MRQTNPALAFLWACLASLLLLSLGLRAGSLDLSVAFDEANRLYEQGRYGAAADAYESLLQAGQSTPSVLHNLGNTRLKNGELGRAIQAFLQAERLAPRDSGIKANLQFARRAVKGAEEWSAPWSHRLVGRLRGNEWVWIASGCGWMFFLLLALREWRPSLRKAIRPLLQTSGALLAVGLIGFFLALDSEGHARAVVVVKEAPVRFTPLEESPVAFTAIDGMEMIVLGQKKGLAGQGDWVEVRDPAQRFGWMKQSQVGFVVEQPRTNPKSG